MPQKTKKLPSYVKLNRQIRPQDDFYTHVCHHWCRSNPLPQAYSRWTHFHKLRDTVDKQIEEIIGQWLEKKRPSAAEKQVVTFYNTNLHKDRYLTQSLKSLQKLSETIMAFKDTPKERARLLAWAFARDLDGFIEVNVGLDPKNHQRYQLSVDPAYLSLPNRDYYLNATAKMRRFRQAYVEFMQTQQAALKKLGFDYQTQPDKILQIETTLARYNLPLADAEDLEKIYNPYSWEKFVKSFDFPWEVYFKELGLKTGRDLIVTQPSYLRKTLKYLKQLSLDQIKQYLIHLLVLRYASLLSEKIVKVQFDFFHKTLSGSQKMLPLKRRVARQTNAAFADSLGRTYVKKHFQDSHKHKVEKMAVQVAEAFRKRLGDNRWMSESSRQYAQDKLDRIVINIGYNDTAWRDYSRIKLTEDNPLENSLRLQEDHLRQAWQLLDQVPDRRKFKDLSQEVQTVNAWTNLFLLNTNYPAGILQPPFYDHQASWEYGLGMLGSVIGHELTHNFDTTGSRIDKQGRYSQWLKAAEKRAFDKASARLAKLAGKHYPTPKVKMKGKQVVGELIADLGGLEIVLDIVKEQHENKSDRRQALKEVFIAYAYMHALNETLEGKIMRTKIDVHPDDVFRVNGVVAHCQDFYEVFNLKKGDGLYLKPADRVRIW